MRQVQLSTITWIFGLVLTSSPLWAAAASPLPNRTAISSPLLKQLESVVRHELATQGGIQPRQAMRPPRSSSAEAAANGVCVTLFHQGRRLGRGTCAQATLAANARLAAAEAWAQVQALLQSTKSSATSFPPAKDLTILLEIQLAALPAGVANPLDLPRRLDSGREGFLMSLRGQTRFRTASDLLSKGFSTKQHFSEVAKELKMTPKDLLSPDLILKRLPAGCALLRPNRPPLVLYRQNPLLPRNAVSHSSLRESLQLQENWFRSVQARSGAFPGQVHPLTGDGEEKLSGRSDLQSKLLACAALGHLFTATGQDSSRKAGKRALQYYLSKHFHRPTGSPLGYLRDDRRIPLGASAAALLSIIQLRELQTYRETADALAAFLHQMRNTDGSYRRDANGKNRASADEGGLAQWALLEYQEAVRDASRQEDLLRSFSAYRRQFRKTRTFAFIPFHTAAGLRLYRATRKPEIARFIFEMNDLLLSMQEREAKVVTDAAGRFQNVTRKQKGRAVLTTTAAALVALGDALQLARDLQDKKRSDRYGQAIFEGLRHLLQRQYRDGHDLWCAPDPVRALGGFRTRDDLSVLRLDGQVYGAFACSRAMTLLSEDDFSRYRR